MDAGGERSRIHERLERGARLPARLAHVIELLGGEIAAAHPRADVSAARVHCHEARLKHGTLLTPPALAVGEPLQMRHLTRDGLIGRLLQPGIDRGAHDESVVIVALTRPLDQPLPQMPDDVGHRAGRHGLALEIEP